MNIRKSRFYVAAMLLPLAAAMTGCTSSPLPPMEVSRFIAPEFLQGQTVAVTNPPIRNGNVPLQVYDAAIAAELDRLGLSPAPGELSPLTAWVSVQRSRREPAPKGSPVSVGVGGSTGSYGSGVGAGIGIDLSGRPKAQIVTDVTVHILDRATRKRVWEARASQSAPVGSPQATHEAAAKALAQALFMDFPGENGESFTVKQK